MLFLSVFISYYPNRNILSITHLRKINHSDLCCSNYLFTHQNGIFSPLHKWEIGPIATHVLELIFHTAKMIQSFHYTFGKSRQFGPMFQYFRYRYLNCHFLSVTHRKNRDRPMIETLWQNQGVPARERPDAGRVRPESDRTSGPVRQATSVKARTGPERPAG